MTHLCPHCGYNFTADEPVTRDGWRIIPGQGAWFRRRKVVERLTWVNILHALATSDGWVSTEALLNRVSTSERRNTINSTVCQLRKDLRGKGVSLPFRGCKGEHRGGYQWGAQGGLE